MPDAATIIRLRKKAGMKTGNLDSDYYNTFPEKQKGSFWAGNDEEHNRVPTLLPNQIPLQEQQVQAAQGPGAGGAFGDAADYWRNNLSDNPQDLEAFTKPEMRKYNEQIIPDLAEQFAGMGAGGLSSSGFQNASVAAGTDLQERLGALRANIRQNAASNLYNAGQGALGNYSQDVMTKQGTEGAGTSIAQGIGAAAPVIGSLFGPWGTLAGTIAGSVIGGNRSQGVNSFGDLNIGKNKDPYGGKKPMTPSTPGNFKPQYQSNVQLPNFMQK